MVCPTRLIGIVLKAVFSKLARIIKNASAGTQRMLLRRYTVFVGIGLVIVGL